MAASFQNRQNLNFAFHPEMFHVEHFRSLFRRKDFH